MMYDPVWHPRIMLLMAIILVAVVILRAWRERQQQVLPRQWPALLLRLVVIGVLLLVVANPHHIEAQQLPTDAPLQVVFDNSASMAHQDVDGEARLAAAVAAYQATAGGMNAQFTTHLHRFDRQLFALPSESLESLAPTGDASAFGSSLAAAITTSVEQGIGGGVLIFTDGRSTDDSALDAGRLALARGVPLWICPLGGVVEQRDVRVHASSGEVLAFAGAPVSLAVDVVQQGFPDQTFALEVVAGDGEAQKIEVMPDADGQARVTFQVEAPASGEMSVRCSIPLQPGENRSDNNSCHLFVRVVAERARVLLLEGQPHWDSKFLVQSLVRCPQVQLTAIHHLANGRRFTVHDDAAEEHAGQALPNTLDQLARYDVIMLGRGCDGLLEEIGPELLADYVAEHGGNLVLCRGNPVFAHQASLTALDPLVYARDEVAGGRLQPTLDGRNHAIFDLAAGDNDIALLADLPTLDAIQSTEGAKPLARILARAGDDGRGIAVAHQPYGLGQVMTVNAAGLWRWAFHEHRNDFQEFVYDRFWLGVVRWMLAGSDFRPGHNVALQSERRLYNDEQTVRLQVRSRGIDQYEPQLTITGPDVEEHIAPRSVGEGRFLAEAGPFAPGDYQVQLTGKGGEPAELALQLRVLSASIEQRELSADPALLAAVAELAEGSIITLEELSDLPTRMRAWQAQRQLNDRSESIWDRWWVLAALLFLLAGEWWLRRRGGLL